MTTKFSYFLKTALLAVIFIGAFPKTSFAQNKVGINITDNFDVVDRAVSVVNADGSSNGGWIVIMPKIGNCGDIQNMLSSYQGRVNFIIRLHYPGTVPYNPAEPQNNYALSWAASLAKIAESTPDVIYVYPWNEPNMARECGGNSDCVEQTRKYVEDLRKYLEEFGLWQTKVKVLSPMINQSAPNFSQFSNALGDSFFSQFSGQAMNLYDFETATHAPCQSSPPFNGCSFEPVLNSIPGAREPAYGVETGVVDESVNCPAGAPECPIFEDDKMLLFLREAYENYWLGNPKIAMASPLFYNPELSSHPVWLWGSQTEAYLKSVAGRSRGSVQTASFDSARANEAIQRYIDSGQLTQCSDSCGLASNNDLCQSAGSPSGSGDGKDPRIPGNKGSCENPLTKTPYPGCESATITLKERISYSGTPSYFCKDPTEVYPACTSGVGIADFSGLSAVVDWGRVKFTFPKYTTAFTGSLEWPSQNSSYVPPGTPKPENNRCPVGYTPIYGEPEVDPDDLPSPSATGRTYPEYCGINYYPSDYPGKIWDYWYDGKGSLENAKKYTQRELAYVKEMGLNVVRTFVPFKSFGGGNVDPKKLQALREFVNIAKNYGIYTTLSLFDDSDIGGSPGPRLACDYNLDSSLKQEYENYAKTIVEAFESEPYVLWWDVVNEPDNKNCGYTIGKYGVDVSESEKKIANAVSMAQYIKTLSSKKTTIGVANAGNWPHINKPGVDIIQIHFYRFPDEPFRAEGELLRILKSIGESTRGTGKQIFLGEFGKSGSDAVKTPYYAQVLTAVFDKFRDESPDSSRFIGLAPWTLMWFTDPAVSADEAGFGLVTTWDNTFKVAAQVYANRCGGDITGTVKTAPPVIGCVESGTAVDTDGKPGPQWGLSQFIGYSSCDTISDCITPPPAKRLGRFLPGLLSYYGRPEDIKTFYETENNYRNLVHAKGKVEIIPHAEGEGVQGVLTDTGTSKTYLSAPYLPAIEWASRKIYCQLVAPPGDPECTTNIVEDYNFENMLAGNSKFISLGDENSCTEMAESGNMLASLVPPNKSAGSPSVLGSNKIAFDAPPNDTCQSFKVKGKVLREGQDGTLVPMSGGAINIVNVADPNIRTWKSHQTDPEGNIIEFEAECNPNETSDPNAKRYTYTVGYVCDLPEQVSSMCWSEPQSFKLKRNDPHENETIVINGTAPENCGGDSFCREKPKCKNIPVKGQVTYKDSSGEVKELRNAKITIVNKLDQQAFTGSSSGDMGYFQFDAKCSELEDESPENKKYVVQTGFVCAEKTGDTQNQCWETVEEFSAQRYSKDQPEPEHEMDIFLENCSPSICPNPNDPGADGDPQGPGNWGPVDINPIQPVPPGVGNNDGTPRQDFCPIPFDTAGTNVCRNKEAFVQLAGHSSRPVNCNVEFQIGTDPLPINPTVSCDVDLQEKTAFVDFGFNPHFENDAIKLNISWLKGIFKKPDIPGGLRIIDRTVKGDLSGKREFEVEATDGELSYNKEPPIHNKKTQLCYEQLAMASVANYPGMKEKGMEKIVVPPECWEVVPENPEEGEVDFPSYCDTGVVEATNESFKLENSNDTIPAGSRTIMGKIILVDKATKYYYGEDVDMNPAVKLFHGSCGATPNLAIKLDGNMYIADDLDPTKRNHIKVNITTDANTVEVIGPRGIVTACYNDIDSADTAIDLTTRKNACFIYYLNSTMLGGVSDAFRNNHWYLGYDANMSDYCGVNENGGGLRLNDYGIAPTGDWTKPGYDAALNSACGGHQSHACGSAPGGKTITCEYSPPNPQLYLENPTTYTRGSDNTCKASFPSEFKWVDCSTIIDTPREGNDNVNFMDVDCWKGRDTRNNEDINICLAVGTNKNEKSGYIYRSFDGGSSWKDNDLFIGSSIYTVKFVGGPGGIARAFISGRGKLIATSPYTYDADGVLQLGREFELQNVESNYKFAVDGSGNKIKTDQKLFKPIYALDISPTGIGYAGSSNHEAFFKTIWRTNDLRWGNTDIGPEPDIPGWILQADKPGMFENSILDIAMAPDDSKVFVIRTPRTLVKRLGHANPTHPDQENWQAVNITKCSSASRLENIESIYKGLMSDTMENLFIVGTKGCLARSDDAGSTWESAVPTSSGYSNTDFAGLDTYKGVIVVGGSGGTILVNRNEGWRGSWEEYQIGSSSINGVKIIDQDTAIAVGSNETIIKTTNLSEAGRVRWEIVTDIETDFTNPDNIKSF